MCTPSFMCKFPFSGREFVAGVRGRGLRLAATASDGWTQAKAAAGTAYAKPPPPHQHAVERLRLAIDCMPWRRARRCSEECAATSASSSARMRRRGGVCPMLAAHRRGGRTDFLVVRQVLGPVRSRRRASRAGDRARAADPRRAAGGEPAGAGGLELDRAIGEHHVLRGRSLAPAQAARVRRLQRRDTARRLRRVPAVRGRRRARRRPPAASVAGRRSAGRSQPRSASSLGLGVSVRRLQRVAGADEHDLGNDARGRGRSRKRTASAMSSGRIISSAAT